MILIICLLLGYLIGGIPTGILVAKWAKGVDPREYGSGSSGATNVSRILGKKWGAIVLTLDALKGYLPVLLIPPYLANENALVSGIAVSAGVVLGHVYTPYARFRGGKGVATGAGAMLGLSPLTLGIALAVWLVIIAMTKTVSVASIGAVIALPVAAFAIPGVPILVSWFSLALSAFIILTHRGNIVRLISRTEKPIL